MENKEFKIIRLKSGAKYAPASIIEKGFDFSEFGDLLPDSVKKEDFSRLNPYKNYLPHDKVEISLGKSRYGGPILDLPKDFDLKEKELFVAQLNMKEVSKCDEQGVLPKTGHLFFFQNGNFGEGRVIYFDIESIELKRRIIEHDQNFYSGVVIENCFSDKESWDSRYRLPEDDWDVEHVNKDGKLWDDFAGSNLSKLFGIFTHCQWDEEEIREMTYSDEILLLQIGEDGFNDEGVLSVTIPKEDLKNLDFKNCKFFWGQT